MTPWAAGGIPSLRKGQRRVLLTFTSRDSDGMIDLLPEVFLGKVRNGTN